MRWREPAWRACYELLAVGIPRADWSCMNYGYESTAADVEPLVLTAAEEPDRRGIQLYRRTLGAVDLRDRDVLEVGSGRGGGAAWIARTVGARSVTGLDFSRSAVTLATRQRGRPGLSFVRGDAQSMPFSDGSFDAVLNVESSHCYSSMGTFLAEVRRILRPGGDLLFADLRSSGDLPALYEQFDRSGLVVDEQHDITAEVLAAMRLDNARKLQLLAESVPRILHPLLRPFAGIEGTVNFVGLASGDIRYLRAHLRKPA